MFRFRAWAVAATLMAMGSASCGADANLIPPKELVAGASQLEWSQRWWQWAFSFDRARSPVADRTGQFCASRQSGPVWFLAGTYGTHRTERTCHVPSGKVLFFPLVNYVTFQGAQRRTCQALIGDAAGLTNDPSALVLEIDGRRVDGLQAHRLAGKDCFSLVPGEPADAAANGYYVALRPLRAGVHTVNFGGILPTLAQAVTYTLIVE
jgi:hypothetical protein